jgi:AcrR family transcriptional regulator
MTDKNSDTEKRILEAARNIFHRKGYAGARMEEIAELAQINKAMLHYYFRSKHKLFETIFMEDIAKLAPQILFVWLSEKTFFDKIRAFVSGYITEISKHPYIPGFVLTELTQNPDYLLKLKTIRENVRGNVLDVRAILKKEIEKEVDAGNIIPIDTEQLLLNIVSMCLFPFMAKPMVMLNLEMDELQFEAFVENRSQQIAEFTIRAIQAK